MLGAANSVRSVGRSFVPNNQTNVKKQLGFGAFVIVNDISVDRNKQAEDYSFPEGTKIFNSLLQFRDGMYREIVICPEEKDEIIIRKNMKNNGIETFDLGKSDKDPDTLERGIIMFKNTIGELKERLNAPEFVPICKKATENGIRTENEDDVKKSILIFENHLKHDEELKKALKEKNLI